MFPGDNFLTKILDCTDQYREIVPRAELVNKEWSAQKEIFMPALFIEAPPGIRPEKNSVMMQKITETVDEAYYIGGTLIFLREYPVENMPMDGRISVREPQNP